MGSGKGTPIDGALGPHRRSTWARKAHYSETAESGVSPGMTNGGSHSSKAFQMNAARSLSEWKGQRRNEANLKKTLQHTKSAESIE